MQPPILAWIYDALVPKAPVELKLATHNLNQPSRNTFLFIDPLIPSLP